MTHYFPSRQGGIEAVAYEINRRLAGIGHNVHWFASAPALLPEETARLHCWPIPAIDLIERLAGVPLPIWISKELFQLWSAIRRCDAVHIHDFIYPGSLLALLFARIWKKRVILTQHIGEIPYNSQFLRYALGAMNKTFGRLALRSASQTVFISNAVESYFRSLVTFRTPPLYVANGVDCTIFHPLSATERKAMRQQLGLAVDGFIALFVGRFVEKKGLAQLEELVRETSQSQWLFAGSGPMHPGQWQAPNVKVFEGYQGARLADLYRVADLLVLPSRGEGFPLVVQEAFACGTPALVSTETAAGCAQARSLLLELPLLGAQAPDQWLAQLRAFQAQPSLLAPRRLAVADFAQTQWNWDRVVRIYDRLYDTCDGLGPIN